MAVFKNERLENIACHKLYLLDEVMKINMTLRFRIQSVLEDSKSTTTWQGAKELQELFDELKNKEETYNVLEREARIESDLHDYVDRVYMQRLRSVVTNELGLECTDETAKKLARRLIAEKRIQSPKGITKEVLLELGLIPAANTSRPTA